MSTTPEEQTESTESAFENPTIRELLRELPPSAKLVARVLAEGKPLSQGELVEESLLPDRTVRYALNRLEDANIIESRYSFRDARKQVYYLSN